MAAGIDTLRVGGNIDRSVLVAGGWSITGVTSDGGGFEMRTRMREVVPGVRLNVIPRQDGVMTGWCEGSVPKYLQDGVNYPAVSVDAAIGAGREWVEAATEFVTWTEEARVNRLDVVSDIRVGDAVEDVLRTVGAMTVGGRAVRAVYRDATVNRAMTVWAKTKRSGSGRLYDKGAESKVEAARGVVRFEAQERKNTLGVVGVKGLSDLDEKRAERLLRDRWDWCGFGEQVVPREELLSRILSAENGWRLDTRLKLAGWVAAGFPQLLNRSSEWRYRQRLAQFGQPGDGEVGWRLDLIEGLVMAA